MNDPLKSSRATVSVTQLGFVKEIMHSSLMKHSKPLFFVTKNRSRETREVIIFIWQYLGTIKQCSVLAGVWFFKKLTNVEWISILLLLWTFFTYLYFLESRFKYLNIFLVKLSWKTIHVWIKNHLLSLCIPFESFLAHTQTVRQKSRENLFSIYILKATSYIFFRLFVFDMRTGYFRQWGSRNFKVWLPSWLENSIKLITTLLLKKKRRKDLMKSTRMTNMGSL